MSNDIFELDNDSEVEALIESLNLPEIRITPAHIEKTVKEVKYHLFEGTNTTVCCLVLQNDYTVLGKSACVAGANFNEKLGRTLAYQDAKRQIGQYEGYLLAQSLMTKEPNDGMANDDNKRPDPDSAESTDERDSVDGDNGSDTVDK